MEFATFTRSKGACISLTQGAGQSAHVIGWQPACLRRSLIFHGSEVSEKLGVSHFYLKAEEWTHGIEGKQRLGSIVFVPLLALLYLVRNASVYAILSFLVTFVLFTFGICCFQQSLIMPLTLYVDITAHIVQSITSYGPYIAC